jgi:hypothetical protein
LPAGRRALDLRGLLVRLHPTVDAGTVCRLFDADLDDLALVAIVEDHLKQEHKEPADG